MMIFNIMKNVKLSGTNDHIYIELENLICNCSVWALGSRFEKPILNFAHKR